MEPRAPWRPGRHRLVCQCLDHRILDRAVSALVARFLDSGYSVAGPVPLPSRRKVWTVLSAPFADKNARAKVGLALSKRLLEVEPLSEAAKPLPEVIEEAALHGSVEVKIPKGIAPAGPAGGASE